MNDVDAKISKLSASRIAAWLRFKDQSSWHQGKTRAELFELWNKGHERAKEQPNPNPRCEYGIKMEPKALKAYCSLMNIEREHVIANPPFHKHAKYPFLGAAPDAVVNTGRHTHIVEIKCPTSLAADPDRMVVPEDAWLLQVHMQMETIKEAEYCDLVVYNGTYLWLWRIRRPRTDSLNEDWDDDAPAEFYVPYTVETYKRDADGTMKIGYREEPPMSLMQALIPELNKYKIADVARAAGVSLDHALLRPDPDAMKRIKVEFIAWKKWAVTNLAVAKPEDFTTGRVMTEWVQSFPGERRTNPFKYTHIDRFHLPCEPQRYSLYVPPFAERLLNIRWLDGDMKNYWEYNYANPDEPYPRGGFIHSQYYPVKQSAFWGGDPTADLGIQDMPGRSKAVTPTAATEASAGCP